MGKGNSVKQSSMNLIIRKYPWGPLDVVGNLIKPVIAVYAWSSTNFTSSLGSMRNPTLYAGILIWDRMAYGSSTANSKTAFEIAGIDTYTWVYFTASLLAAPLAGILSAIHVKLVREKGAWRGDYRANSIFKKGGSS